MPNLDELREGVAAMRDAGFRVTFAPPLQRLMVRGQFAGPDDVRAAGLMDAVRDPDVSIVWEAWGGDGALRVLPHLEPKALASCEGRKLFVGYSDATAVHAAFQKAGVRSVHGPVAAEVTPAMLAALGETGFNPLVPLRGDMAVTEGRTTAPVVGGNLSLVSALVGTPWEPDFDGKILLLEDENDSPGNVERKLTHLRLAGKLDRLAGLAFGEFTGCHAPEGKRHGWRMEEVLEDALRSLDVPAAMGFPVGHGTRNLPVLLGHPYTLDADAATLSPEGDAGWMPRPRAK